MTTVTADSDRPETRLTTRENAQMENREQLARVESKVDSLTDAVANLTSAIRELNRRIDRLFYLGLAPRRRNNRRSAAPTAYRRRRLITGVSAHPELATPSDHPELVEG